MSDWTIERMAPEAWERVRAVRLRALADAPDAFGTTLAEDEARPLEQWRTRLENPDAATFLARAEGRDVGTVTGWRYPDREEAAGLFGMWLAPASRGSGIADALVQAVTSWARSAGYRRLFLDVADTNLPATRLYERTGFRPTGVTGSLPAPREDILEHERVLEL